jgi:hypothetical protein
MESEMSTEKTPGAPEPLGSGEKMADSAVRDTAEYLAKSFAAFLLSLSSLALTGLGWLFKGLSAFFAKLAEWSFLGAGELHATVKRIRWHKKDKDAE